MSGRPYPSWWTVSREPLAGGGQGPSGSTQWRHTHAGAGRWPAGMLLPGLRRSAGKGRAGDPPGGFQEPGRRHVLAVAVAVAGAGKRGGGPAGLRRCGARRPPRSAVRAGPFAGRGNVRARGSRPCRPWEAAGRAVLRAYRFSSQDDAGQGPCRRRIPVRGPVRALGRDFSRMRGPVTAGEGADGARCRGAAVRPISGVAVLVLPSWMPVPAVVPSGTWRARTRSAGAAARRRRRIPRAPTEALMAPVVSSLSLSVVPSSVSGVRAGRITAVERLFLHVGAARKRLRTATVARAFGQVGRRLSGSKQGA